MSRGSTKFQFFCLKLRPIKSQDTYACILSIVNNFQSHKIVIHLQVNLQYSGKCYFMSTSTPAAASSKVPSKPKTTTSASSRSHSSPSLGMSRVQNSTSLLPKKSPSATLGTGRMTGMSPATGMPKSLGEFAEV